MQKLQPGSHSRRYPAFIIALTLLFGATLSWHATVAVANDEGAIRAVVTQRAAAHEAGDLATIEKLWVHDDSATVAENGEFNYGWTTFRDQHLRPEMEAMKNVKFPIEDIKIHVKGSLAWVTYSFRLSGEYKGRNFDGAGAATLVLEKRGSDWRIVHEHASTKRRPAAAPKPPEK